MKKSPYFSVIIPTKNEEKLIGNCLKSLKKQETNYPYEIIVVDTASKDKTRQIVKKYKVRLISESKSGKNIACQKGALQAKGEILVFTEADCVVPTNWLNEIANSFQKYKGAIAVTGGYTYYNSTNLYNLLARIFLPLLSFFFNIFFGHNSLRTSNFAIYKQIFNKIGGFNLINYELYDVELSMKAKKFGKIYYLSRLNISTSDRRIRGRFLKFLKEFTISFFTVAIRNKPVTRSIYADIR